MRWERSQEAMEEIRAEGWCQGSLYLPRAMAREDDGSLVGMCAWCEQYLPVEPVPNMERTYVLSGHKEV